MNPKIKLDKQAENPMGFELVVGKKDGCIDNASIPVRWCLTKSLLDHINDEEYLSPQILIEVEYISMTGQGNNFVAREERHLFPLNQFIAYIPLSRAGIVNISAFIVGIKKGSIKTYSHVLLSKIHGDYDTTDLANRSSIYYSLKDGNGGVCEIVMISNTLDYRMVIPAGIFGKKPPEWLLSLMNRYQSKTLVDECALRWRKIGFPFKYLFLILPEGILRLMGMTAAYLTYWVFGSYNLSTMYFRHPLIYGLLCYSRDTNPHRIDKFVNSKTIWQGIGNLFIMCYTIPAIPIATLAISYWAITTALVPVWPAFWLTLVAPALLCMAACLIAGLVYAIYWLGKTILYWMANVIFTNKTSVKIDNFFSKPFNWVADLADRFALWYESRASHKQHDELLKYEKYLTCNNDPHSVTAEVSKIAILDRTPSLIYHDIKNKVCKPLER